MINNLSCNIVNYDEIPPLTKNPTKVPNSINFKFSYCLLNVRVCYTKINFEQPFPIRLNFPECFKKNDYQSVPPGIIFLQKNTIYMHERQSEHSGSERMGKEREGLCIERQSLK